jgi:very-short-patch-repair endonuclease
MLFYNTKLKKYSQELRKNMTEAERLLWSRIRKKQIKGFSVYRQRIIGNYIVDFYCPRAKLIIEIDGGQHYTDKGIEEDKKRDEYMRDLGFKVLRFSSREIIKNLDGVMQKIYIESNLPCPLFIPPFLKGGGGIRGFGKRGIVE